MNTLLRRQNRDHTSDCNENAGRNTDWFSWTLVGFLLQSFISRSIIYKSEILCRKQFNGINAIGRFAFEREQRISGSKMEEAINCVIPSNFVETCFGRV